MKLIVGLGNPGIQYAFTPHNMGFLALDRIAEQHGVRIANRHCRALTGKAVVAGEPVLLAKPETYMNLSGLSVRELVEEYQADSARDLVVLHDELDLPLGSIRIRPRGGSAGHNGIASIMGALGTEEFLRVRIGIAPEHEVRDGSAYVLAQWKRSQYPAVDQVLDTVAEAVTVLLEQGVERAMNRFNRRPEPEKQAGG